MSGVHAKIAAPSGHAVLPGRPSTASQPAAVTTQSSPPRHHHACRRGRLHLLHGTPSTPIVVCMLETKMCRRFPPPPHRWVSSPCLRSQGAYSNARVGEFVPQKKQQAIASNNSTTNNNTSLQQKQQQQPRMVTLSTDAAISNTIAKYSDNPKLRRQVYLETVTSCPENLSMLDAMIRLRHEVAAALGSTSYADRVLQDKMAQNQTTVYEFLFQLQQLVTRHYRRDTNTLLDMKRRHEGARGSSSSGTSPTIEPWDIPFYTGLFKAQNGTDEAHDMTPYITVDIC